MGAIGGMRGIIGWCPRRFICILLSGWFVSFFWGGVVFVFWCFSFSASFVFSLSLLVFLPKEGRKEDSEGEREGERKGVRKK